MDAAPPLARLQSLLAEPVGLPLGLVLLALAVGAALAWVALAARARLRRARFRQKSSEVRTGHLVEALAPLLDDFPVDVTRPETSTVFLGQPVDYVHFDPAEGITFVEVKSGDSKLNERQRRLRELVESGAVRWTTYRRR